VEEAERRYHLTQEDDVGLEVTPFESGHKWISFAHFPSDQLPFLQHNPFLPNYN
jgi:hypothetical protein